MDRLSFEALKLSLDKKIEIQVKVASDSMYPVLKVDEVLTVTKIKEKIKMFDLIVFFQSNRLNCHFLWRDQIDFDNTYVTKSLKELSVDDPPIKSENILGVVRGKSISLFQKLKIYFYVSVMGR